MTAKFVKLTSYSSDPEKERVPVYVNLDLSVSICRTKSVSGAPQTVIEFAAISDEHCCSETVMETPEEIFRAAGMGEL